MKSLKHYLSIVIIAIFRPLQLLPFFMFSFLGFSLGYLIFIFPSRRKRIAERNLELCFPDTSSAIRSQWVRKHFQAYIRAALEHSVLFWGSANRLKRMVEMKGFEHFEVVKDRPVIFFAPHFVGLDAGGIRLSIDCQGTSLYGRQSNPLFDQLLKQGRERFGTKLVLRTDGIRQFVRYIRQKRPAYYLPDMDLGTEGALFIPFFGVPAATVPGLSRLVKMTGAVIVPCIAWQKPWGGYTMEFFPAWTEWTGEDSYAETLKMHDFLETHIRRAPWQYLWTHKRFKTRPEGMPSVYD